MAKKVIKKLMAKNGSTYTGNDGQQKNSYTRCGVLMIDTDTKEVSIKIEALPIDFNGWINCWDLDGDNVKEKAGLNQGAQQQASPPQSPPQTQDESFPNEDIPW